MSTRSLREKPYGFEVDVENFIPIGFGEVGGWVSTLDSTAVDEDVDGTSCREREGSVEEGFDGGEVCEVGFDGRMFLARGLVGDGGER